MSGDLDPSAKPQLPIQGAFEVFEGNREELITLTRNGRLTAVGDYLPYVPGVELSHGPIVLHIVNAFGTETMCDTCTDIVEAFHRSNPDVPIYSLTKQSSEEIAAEDAKNGREITHPRVQVSHETAVDLGVALAPGEGADPEFWSTALRRSLVVVQSDGMISHIQQPNDQDEMLDFTQAFEEIESLP